MRRLALLLVLSACGDAAPEPDVDAGELAATPAATPGNRPGSYRHRVTVDGAVRETLVYVPASASGPAAVPVVFMFHGSGGDGRKFYEISGWREKADAEGLIAVFPTALVHCYKEDENADGDFADPGELKVGTKWAAGKLGDPARMPLCSAEELAALPPDRRAAADHPLADDLAFVRAMLDRLPLGYAVDARRVYASGFSNGGGFTSRLALEMADRFAAIGAASGGLDLDATPAARPLTIVFSGGAADDRVTEKLGISPLPLDESLVAIPEIEALIANYLVIAGLDAGYAYGLEGGIARFDYTTSLAGGTNHVSFLMIEGLGHQYPNGRNHPVVMADVLWESFRGESLPWRP
jgi:polyhydroxybutyrate depolymerase